MSKKYFTKTFIENGINIGYIDGSNKVLFIKTGQGGSIFGYENKYLNLAVWAKEQYGCSVVVSSTSVDTQDAYDYDMNFLEQIAGENIEVYYLGVSKGGLIGCWYGLEDGRIKRMTTVNAPLMINYHNRTLPALKKATQEQLTMIYGSEDPSAFYTQSVAKYVKVEIIEGEDHYLKNGKTSLIQIVDKYLLFDLRIKNNKK